jgi:hypothetical protein
MDAILGKLKAQASFPVLDFAFRDILIIFIVQQRDKVIRLGAVEIADGVLAIRSLQMSRQFVQHTAIINEKCDQVLKSAPLSDRHRHWSRCGQSNSHIWAFVETNPAHLNTRKFVQVTETLRRRLYAFQRQPPQMLCDEYVLHNGAAKGIRKRRHIISVRDNVVFNALYYPSIAFLKSDSIDLNFFQRC